MKSQEDMIRDLKTFPLLSKLSDEDLTLLAGVMREQSFRAGTEILREGDPYYNPNLSMITQDFSLRKN